MEIKNDIIDAIKMSDTVRENEISEALKKVAPSDIILLSLSKLKNVSETRFTVEGTDYSGSYMSQLEPVVRYRLDTIDDKGRDLQIIALCTSDTRTDTNNSVHCTALDYFIERVGLIKGECGYSGNVDVYPIDISENNPMGGVSATVEYIRAKHQKQQDDKQSKKYDLWIDTHGGFRDIALIIEAVVSLLKSDGIIPDKIFGIRYEENKPAILVDQMNSFLMFDFVSGMNEFFSFGRSKKLTEYYKSIKSENRQFHDLINNISDAIQLCDIDEFDKAIKQLNEDYIKPEFENKKQSVPFVSDKRIKAYEDIFIESIKRSFGKLLYSDRERNKVINKIEWCIDNDFIQQALTIIESQMPTEFEQRNIIYYKYDHKDTKENDVYRKGSDGNPQLVGKIKLKEAIKNKKPSWEIEINYAMIHWIRHGICERDEKDKPTNPPLNIYDENVELPENIFRKKIRLWDVEDTEDSRYHYIELEFGMHSKIWNDITNRKKLARLLLLHMALKDQRNASNHASSRERVTVEEVIRSVKEYINLTRQIFDIVGIK